MFNKNSHSANQQNHKATSSQDWREFDQDYPGNGLKETDELDWTEEAGEIAGAGSADSGIPSFGHNVKNGPGNSNGISPNRPANSLTNRTGLNTKGAGGQTADLPAAKLKLKNSTGAVLSKADNKAAGKNKPAKPKRPAVKRDNRWRFFFGLTLFVVGMAGSILLVQSSTKGVEVIVATRDIAAGQGISPADFVTARMSIPPDLAATLLSPSDLKTLTTATGEEGAKPARKVAARLLRAHQPIMQGDVASLTSLNKTGVPAGLVAMALPVSASTAVSRISPGDQVTLLFVDNKNNLADQAGIGTGKAANAAAPAFTILAEHITVLDVSRSNSGVSLGSSGGSSGMAADNTGTTARGTLTNLTLLLTLEQAQRVAMAKETGVINVVLLPFEIEVKQAGITSSPPNQGDSLAQTPPASSPADSPEPTGAVKASPGPETGTTSAVNPGSTQKGTTVIAPVSPQAVTPGPAQNQANPSPTSTGTDQATPDFKTS